MLSEHDGSINMDAGVLLQLLLYNISKTTVSFEIDGKEILLDQLIPDLDDEYHLILSFKFEGEGEGDELRPLEND